jgi:predicted TIM-barrel fold metal-dependent hydrolase
VGFKFLCDYYGVALSDKRHLPYWEYANDNRLLVLCHTWGQSPFDGPEEAEKILSKYPDLVLIAGHSFHGQWDKAVELASRYPNLYLELTAVLDDRGALELFVEKLGSERILFGVDLPWFSYYYGIGAVLSARISDEARRNILYRNGVKLLERFPWFGDIWDTHRLML